MNASANPPTNGPRYTQQTVLSKTDWLTDKLFSITVSRDPAFSFLPGQFARLGLCVGAPDSTDPEAPPAPNEWRAYSMVSRPDVNALEFYSVVVPDGKFSPALARLKPGDALWIDKTVFGFLTLERFVDGEDLWLIATGTGLSAYLSMLRDSATWTALSGLFCCMVSDTPTSWPTARSYWHSQTPPTHRAPISSMSLSPRKRVSAPSYPHPSTLS